MEAEILELVRLHNEWFVREWKKADEGDIAGQWNEFGHENERRHADLGRAVLVLCRLEKEK